MDNIVFLVAVPKGPLYNCCMKIQKFLWKEYDLGNDLLPQIHLTIDGFYYDDEKELDEIQKNLEKLISKIDPFEIRSNGFGYIPSPHKCITLHIVKTEELKKTYGFIHKNMQQKGFKVREFSPEEMVFHISLAGIHGREWSEEEMKQAWEKVRDFKLNESSLIDHLELWYPDLDPKKRLIKRLEIGQTI
ncbi:2'-5' RNA ligase family protein [Inediibacterium massiliense]|uniref:2'-5' RNA ligase family protein n=1 Tax=Inediibacterium massiliense TaxID=1658111 RepID=UPI0006B6626C|nr:2'-5' RNA ligase family protein [Inediibacterium massiliense]